MCKIAVPHKRREMKEQLEKKEEKESPALLSKMYNLLIVSVNTKPGSPRYFAGSPEVF